MVNTIWMILAMFFVGILSYFYGMYRAWREFQHEFDKGYIEGYDAAKREGLYDSQDWEDRQRAGFKAEKAKKLVEELDELFKPDQEEDVEILDGGTY